MRRWRYFMKQDIQWLEGTDDLTEAYDIRIQVFCDEQGYTQDMELDEQDKQSMHILLRDGEEAIATGRIYWSGPDTMCFGRIAVHKSMRGKGIGKIVLDAMMEKAQSLGAKNIELDAQCYAVGFYEKSGFTVCGKEHLDGHVLHKMMQKQL